MRLPQSSSPRMAKSTSLGVIEHDHDNLHIVDQDDIIGLTQDVKNFSDGLANLKAVFNNQDSKILINEPPHGKTNNLHRGKQRRRSASQ